ncbi:major facilitator superfamily domain-containing protein [Pisolithus thermaeus]|nr:major facilitator superfamily domain-containing protein [Pisolithus thermaeus]
MASPMQTEKPRGRALPGASWQDKEEHVLPKNRLGIVFLGLMCSVFLAALDQTIVATALPTIVARLGGGDQYSWVGSAYMLSAGAFGPLYGKLSNMFGRKPILYASICTFLLGSALCGAAQSMIWLIVARAVQGIGGGGIIQLVIITISDIVPLKDRGRYGGFVGATFGVASVLGPLLGGVLTERVSWRWCFFINLPTGGVAAMILFVFLNLNPHQSRPIRDQVAELDFVGLFSFVGGVVCLLLGFQFSQTSWSDAKTIALLVVGCTLLVLGGVNEVITTRSAIVPARLFKTRTTAILLVSAVLHAITFFTASYYLPLYYQVLGASATGAGIRMIPFSLGTAIMSIVAGVLNSRTGKCRPIIWFAYATMTLGWGLMTMLDYNSNNAEKELYPFVATLGVGCLFQVPIIAIQAAMPIKDMATASSAFMFLRTVGGAVGISVGEAIISSLLSKKMASIPGIGSYVSGSTAALLNDDVSYLHLIPDVAVRDALLHAYSRSISAIWIMNSPISGAALILTLFLREYSMARKIVKGEATTPNDAEMGDIGEEARDKTEEGHGADLTRTNSIAPVPKEEILDT